MAQQKGAIVRLYGERREENMKNKILAEGVCRRKGRRIYQFGFSCLACIDIVLRYAKEYVDRRWDDEGRFVSLLVRLPESCPCLFIG